MTRKEGDGRERLFIEVLEFERRLEEGDEKTRERRVGREMDG